MISRAWLPERVASAMWRSFRISPCALNPWQRMRSPLEPGFQMPAHYPVHRELSVRTHSLLSPHTALKNGDLNRQLWRHGLPSLLQNFQPHTGTAPGSHGIPGTPVWLGNFQRILDTSHEVELFPNCAVSLEQFAKTSKKKRQGKTKDLGGRF